MKRLIWLLCILLSLHGSRSLACTIVMVSGPSLALAGSNEDSSFPLTLLWFTPATGDQYARVNFGYRMMMPSVQGGMNEKGLFVDGNSLNSQGWKADEAKQGLMASLLDYILANCADVEEVKQLFLNFNVPALDQARIPVMDKSGASMIVEWYQGEVVFLETDLSYQVATNFVGSAYMDQEKPCWRYNSAMEVLESQKEHSILTVRFALEASHQEGASVNTVYSFICDLKKGEIHVYNFHDFSNPLKFNLAEELNSGQHTHYLGQLFTARSPEYLRFLEEGPAKMIQTGYDRNMRMAMMFYHSLKSYYPIAYDQQISYHTLSQVGRDLLKKGRLADAIVFLLQNARDFPETSQVQYELASAYLQNGQEDKARAAYEKTLDLDPAHKGAREALDKLPAPG